MDYVMLRGSELVKKWECISRSGESRNLWIHIGQASGLTRGSREHGWIPACTGMTGKNSQTLRVT
jgi:hypothetical protein